MTRKIINAWLATASLEDLSGVMGACMGTAFARLGKERALFLMNSIWQGMLKKVPEMYGLDVETFKGTEP